MSLRLKGRIFLDKKLNMVDDVGGVLVLLFQLVVVRLDLDAGPRPDQHRNLLENVVRPPRSLTFHELSVFLEVINVKDLLSYSPRGLSRLSHPHLREFPLS